MCAISHMSSAPKFLSDSLTLAPVIGNPQAISDMTMDLRWAAVRVRAKARLSQDRNEVLADADDHHVDHGQKNP